MRHLIKLIWVETKLFLREPVTVIFTFALPLMVLYILGGVFGNEPTAPGEQVVFGGYGPTNYYTPAYVALAVAGVALISVPTHLVEYRETGVLRRLRASGTPQPFVLVSQLAVSLLISTAGVGLLLIAAFLFTDVVAPASVPRFAAAYVVGAVAIALFGLVLGTLLPTARAAQSVGLLLWFMFLFLSGAGPPPEVLPASLRTVGEALPLTHVIALYQEPWLEGVWPWSTALIVAGIGLASGLLAWRFQRWE